MAELNHNDPLVPSDASALEAYTLMLTPTRGVKDVLLAVYRLGRAQGRIDGLDRAQAIREEANRA